MGLRSGSLKKKIVSIMSKDRFRVGYKIVCILAGKYLHVMALLSANHNAQVRVHNSASVYTWKFRSPRRLNSKAKVLQTDKNGVFFGS